MGAGLDRHLAAARQGEMVDDRQAQARPRPRRASRSPEPSGRHGPLLRGHAGALVGHHEPPTVPGSCAELDRDGGPRGSDGHGVRQQVVEDLLHAPVHGPHHQPPGPRDRDRHLLALGDPGPGLGPPDRDGGHVDVHQDGLGGLGSGDHQQRLDELAQPVGLGQRRRHTGLVVGVGVQRLEAEPEGGERGAELVGGIGHEPPMRLHHLLETLGGRVELAGEGPQPADAPPPPPGGRAGSRCGPGSGPPHPRWPGPRPTARRGAAMCRAPAGRPSTTGW